MKYILHSIPNVIVFAVLLGIFYFGVKTGWKMPKFSKLVSDAKAAASSEDWCGDHLVPETLCIECKPELLPKAKDFGFCKEHGVLQCVIHHPELAQLNISSSTDSADGHLPRYNTAAAIALIKRTANNPADNLCSKRVQFTSKESVDKSGVKVDIAGEGAITESITANSELIFDPNSVVLLSSKVSGTFAVINKIVGDKVRRGEVLALVDSSQIGLLKTEFIKNVVQLKLHRDNVARLTPLVHNKMISAQEMLQAQTALQEAEVSLLATKQQFANLGFTLPEFSGNFTEMPEEIAAALKELGIPPEMQPKNDTANLIPLTAPFDGVVITSEAVLGKQVEPAVPQFTVCDPLKLWIMLDVRQEDAPYIRLGQKIEFNSDLTASQPACGTISWISPQIDEKTRTLKIRAEVNNETGKLRGNTFGIGRIILREEKNAILVPIEAIQSTKDSQFIFVRDKDYFKKPTDSESPHTVFYPRQAVLGAKGEGVNAGKIEVLAGVLPGEVIAAKGSNVLLAHLLRANLGAGCCAED